MPNEYEQTIENQIKRVAELEKENKRMREALTSFCAAVGRPRDSSNEFVLQIWRERSIRAGLVDDYYAWDQWIPPSGSEGSYWDFVGGKERPPGVKSSKK